MRRSTLMLLVVAACAGWASCSRDDPDGTASDNPAEAEESNEGEHQSSLVYLRKLGAPGGGAWAGSINGGRIIMWLGTATDDAYVTVLRSGTPPAAFGVYGLAVFRDGTFYMTLQPIERGPDGTVRAADSTTEMGVSGVIRHDVVGFTEISDDKNGVFPPKVELRRCPGPEEKEARKAVEDGIK